MLMSRDPPLSRTLLRLRSPDGPVPNVSADDSSTIPPVNLPPILRAEVSTPIIPPGRWIWTIAPAYAGVFATFPILDRIGRALDGRGTSWAEIGESFAAAVLGVLACCALVYTPLARWGRSSGRRLGITSASAFGTGGAEWITGVGVALGAIVAYAVALHMALRLVFLGLVACDLIEPSDLRPWNDGPIRVESPVFVATAAFWIFITGATALLRIPSVIFALMQVYTPVALLLMAATAMLAQGGPRVAATHFPPSGAGLLTQAEVIQLLFGAFSLSGLYAIEWGMASRDRRAIRLGGWVGILFAGSFAATMALLVVAGTVNRSGPEASEAFSAATDLVASHSLHAAIFYGIGGRVGGTILMLFGMASLAPACYAIWVFSHRLHDHWPFLSRWRWTWFGSLPALVLVATSWAGRIELIFGLLGAVFAPAAGVIAAEALLHRFRWRGVREGWNLPGVLAWAVGVGLGLVLIGRLEPAALVAYLSAAGSYPVLARLLGERSLVALSGDAPPTAEPALAGGAKT